MNPNYSHVTFILDRSGSMSNTWNDVVGGYKTFIEDQKKEVGKCTFSLVTFDNTIEIKEDFKDIAEVSDILDTHPRGGTALYDALGSSIVALGEKLAAMDENERPSKVLIVLQTDGEENSSREFNSKTIQELVQKQTDEFKWQFMFLGADKDCLNKAVSMMGINAGNAAVYGSTQSMTTGLGNKVSQMRSMSSDLYASGASMLFSEDEREDLLK